MMIEYMCTFFATFVYRPVAGQPYIRAGRFAGHATHIIVYVYILHSCKPVVGFAYIRV